ncbi:MAG: phosphatase PAP2 family protein [Woeseiaceae bacterium]|nr:phosphatase PAP2 family protein [Woeseiaceae bacterium]
MIHYLDNLEVSACARVNSLSRYRPIREFFRAISRLGDYSAYVVVGVACAATLEHRGLEFLSHALAVAATGIAIYKLLKSSLVRERPFITHDRISCAAAPLDRYSFPSGHTMHAVSFAVLYSAYIPEFAWLMVPFAILVGLSRVILGLHYPSDVVAGGLLGALLAKASLYLVG